MVPMCECNQQTIVKELKSPGTLAYSGLVHRSIRLHKEAQITHSK